MLDGVCCFFVQNFEGDPAGEADLFAAPVFIHVGVKVVTSDDDVFGAKEADCIARVPAGGRAQRALRKTVPIVGQLAKDKRRVRQDVHLAVGRAAHTESGGGAEMKLDGGHLAGWPLWLLPATVKVLHAVVTGQRMAARGREDFANMESNVFELDRGAITLKKVADKALEENGIKQGDAQPAFLPGVDGELALLAMSVAFEGGDGEGFTAVPVVDDLG